MKNEIEDKEKVREMRTSIPKLSELDLKKITRSDQVEDTAIAGLTCTGC